MCIKNKGKLYSDLILGLITINYMFQMGMYEGFEERSES